ncbi:MAG: acyl carrier protein [Armatimonadetes bacterium]|nr:acyl carrier protein [Armatimonadota bacterium]
MGLDNVELILKVEQVFDFQITDEEAFAVVTVGDLRDLITRKVEKPVEHQGCPSQIMFHRLRRALVSVCQIARSAVRPSASMADLIPTAGRRRSWENLSQHLRVKLPSLAHPEWMVWLLGLSALVIAATLGSSLYYSSSTSTFVYQAPASWFFLTLFLSHLARRYATDYVAGCETVGGVCKALVRDSGISQPRSWSKNEIWTILVSTFEIDRGCSKEEIKPEARIVQELGLE